MDFRASFRDGKFLNEPHGVAWVKPQTHTSGSHSYFSINELLEPLGSSRGVGGPHGLAFLLSPHWICSFLGFTGEGLWKTERGRAKARMGPMGFS